MIVSICVGFAFLFGVFTGFLIRLEKRSSSKKESFELTSLRLQIKEMSKERDFFRSRIREQNETIKHQVLVIKFLRDSNFIKFELLKKKQLTIDTFLSVHTEIIRFLDGLFVDSDNKE